MTRHSYLTGLLLVPSLVSMGCAGAAPRQTSWFNPGRPFEGVVFSVDGAGGFQATSSSLAEAIEKQRMPLRIVPVEWSHGYGRVIADQVDYGYAEQRGAELAQAIATTRCGWNGSRIYVVAHSAGTAVALAAAERVPPDTITRLVLLAPSVSADYDVRPALRACSEGIDVFYSRRDVGYLGIGVGILGTADRRWTSPAAGRVGFCPNPGQPGDVALYGKLRQHGWDASVAWTGNRGGHYDGYRADFLCAYVLPLLTAPRPVQSTPNQVSCAAVTRAGP